MRAPRPQETTPLNARARLERSGKKWKEVERSGKKWKEVKKSEKKYRVS